MAELRTGSAGVFARLWCACGVWRTRGKAGRRWYSCHDAYTVTSARAGFEQRGKGWRVRQFLRIENLADRDYVGSVIVADGNRRFYEPAPGRNYLLGIEATITF